MRRRHPFRHASTIALSSLAIVAAGWGVYQSTRSPLFTVRVVEMSDLSDESPVDSQSILDLAAVRVGKVSLFELDLPEVEKRILSHPWIRAVQLEKRFPQTVAITPIFREPKALIQQTDGKLGYVDANSQIFGRVTVGVRTDLPLFSPHVKDPSRMSRALKLVEAWNVHGLIKTARVDSLDWDSERGFRALVTYPLGPTPQSRARVMVELGSGDWDASQFTQLKSVLQYLSDNRLQARQIWADIGKKIVVKIARRS